MSDPPVPDPLAWVRRVRVGSTNGSKLVAVRSAMLPYAPNVQVAGVAVAALSSPSSTPISTARRG